MNGYVSQQGTCDKKINTPSSTLQSILHDQICGSASIDEIRSRELNLACRRIDRNEAFRAAKMPSHQMPKPVKLGSWMSRSARRAIFCRQNAGFNLMQKTASCRLALSLLYRDAKNRQIGSHRRFHIVSRCKKPSGSRRRLFFGLYRDAKNRQINFKICHLYRDAKICQHAHLGAICILMRKTVSLDFTPNITLYRDAKNRHVPHLFRILVVS